ncbi:MAG: YaeQ family protein [Agarilytica sp.]
MAIKATIFKLKLDISDLSRNYYHLHSLTLARHPSENDERMMVRLAAFAFNADERLAFTKGLSTDEEPDLWSHTLSGELDLWIDVGRPSIDRIRKACGKAARVRLYTFGGNTADMWWQTISGQLTRYSNLEVFMLAQTCSEQLAATVNRTMDIQCTIDGGNAWFSIQDQTIEVSPLALFPPE